MSDAPLLACMRAIAAGDEVAVGPELARARLAVGASRAQAKEYFLDALLHYVYGGDTALHVAAAAYRHKLVGKLMSLGADVHAQNRRGAQPLHYAADGGPRSPTWNPRAQAATLAALIEAGADPNAGDRGGVTALHRAVRTRCAAAVQTLLEGGADPRLKNKNGSMPMQLARANTGRGGTGLPEAKAQQAEIVELLRRHGG